MSTSDAAELALGARGETATPLTTRATREQDETFSSESFKQENNGDETPTSVRHQSHRSAIRQDQAHKERILRTDRVRQSEAADCGDSKVQKPIGPTFSSCLFFNLSRISGFDKSGLRLEKNLVPNLDSLTKIRRAETESSRNQIIGKTSTPDTSIREVTYSPSSSRIHYPAKEKEDIIAVVCNELDANRELSITNSFPDGESGLHECDNCTRLVKLENSHTKLVEETDPGELSCPTQTMLSSSVVTVLAPHWSGRLRRNKNIDGTVSSEAQGNVHDGNTLARHAHECFPKTPERSLTDGCQAQSRTPLLTTRRSTVDWTNQCGPGSLDYESQRKINHTGSLDRNSGRMENETTVAGPLSPVTTTESSLSPLFLDPNEQRRSRQAGHQGGSTKPTTSSLLLSLRRLNSNGKNSNPTSTLSELNPLPLSSAPSVKDGKLSPTHIPQTFHNNNEQDRSKTPLSPSSSSYLAAKTGPVFSSSSSTPRERTTFEKHHFQSSPIIKDAENSSFTQQPQIIHRAQSSLLISQQAFPSKGPSELQKNCRSSDKSKKSFSESSVSACLPPRRTALTSTSWWKQVTQEGSSPPMLNDTRNIKDKMNTPCNDKAEFASQSPTHNKILSCLVPNNKTEPVCKRSMNLVMKTHGETHEERKAKDLTGHDSDTRLWQQYGSNLNNKELQKPQSLPGVASSSKISRARNQTTLTHPKDRSRDNLTNSSFTINLTELPPRFLSPTSPNTPTESSSKYNDNHCTFKTNSTPTFPRNMESQKFTQPSLSLANINTLNSQALTLNVESGPSLAENNRSGSFFHSIPLASQTNSHASAYPGTSSQTSKFTNKSNNTPLGFERSYASIPKPFQSKNASGLISTVYTIPKTNYSPLSTASTSSSSTSGSHPATTTAPSPSIVTPPVTPALTSSPTTMTVSTLLTPPATPSITSPYYLDNSHAKGETFSCNKYPPKLSSCVEGKKVRKVTWEDSVDQLLSESITVEKSEPSLVSRNPSPPRSLQSVTLPSIFTFLRPSSPTTDKYPVGYSAGITSSTPVMKGGKYQSLSSDSTDVISRAQKTSKQRPVDQERGDGTTPKQERTFSVESGTDQYHSSSPLSPSPESSSGYKLRYSSPPYSTLMSKRITLGETKTITPRSQLFQQASQSNYTPHISKPPLSPINLSRSLSLPVHNETATQENSKFDLSLTDQVNNNHGKNSKDCQNGQILLVTSNKVHVGSQPLQGDKMRNSSNCVTETLVYSIKSKVDTATANSKNTTAKPFKHTVSKLVSVETKSSQQPLKVQINEGTCELHLEQHSSDCNSSDSQIPDDESCNRRMKENIMGKNRFSSIESNNEHIQKKSRFALKKSVTTASFGSSKSDSERANKTTKKVDQVLNRLKQTFKRASQTPSISGSSDISSVRDFPVESTGTPQELEQEKGIVQKDEKRGTESARISTKNRHTLKQPSAVKSPVEKTTTECDQDEQNAHTQHINECQNRPQLTTHSTDYKPPNLFIASRELSPLKSPNLSPVCPAQFRKSPSSPRSPFSPFASLSPLSPFSSTDVTDDNVFYSPKVQRRKESLSPREPVEGFSLGGSRRSRASTGPPTLSPGQKRKCLSSSCADLKFGIEPGRTFSVSSVLSSRPSGPGRISTGTRFMSMGDLSKSALTCADTGKDLDQWSVHPDLTTEYDYQNSKDCLMSFFTNDPGKMRSRSLPRSLTRRLANSNSGVSASQLASTITSNTSQRWSPTMKTCNFAWDTEGPPTPPPTPPLSPVSRRMSSPSSRLSPPFQSSSGSTQPMESQSSKGHLPSRGYVSSLSTFDESSDSSSDTTTDDEYYLETDEVDEKETEL